MKAINLKFVPEPDGEGSEGFSYADQLRRLVRAPMIPAQFGGHVLSVDDVIGLTSVWKAIEKAEDGAVLVLDKDDHAALVAHLGRIPWAGFNPVIADFLSDVKDAPEWTPPAEAQEAEGE